MRGDFGLSRLPDQAVAFDPARSRFGLLTQAPSLILKTPVQ
jgi:hypothetical protein